MEEIRIKLELNSDGKIEIFNNGKVVLEIPEDSKMELKGSDIFASLEYKVDKVYILEELNELENVSLSRKYKAAEKLHEFYKDLIIKINETIKIKNNLFY